MSDRIAVLNDGILQQLDAPEELYHHPKSEFVARFIGESNLLPGKVKSVTWDKTEITLRDGNTVKVSAAGISKGESVKILVRPENVHIAYLSPARGRVAFGGNLENH